jgi:sulfite exporter TauE/SafE
VIDLISVFAASVVGSLHCAGMCGGFSAVLGGFPHPRRAWLAHHTTRVVAYAALGALAGSVGAGLDRAATVAGVQSIAGPLAGASLIVIALQVLWRGEVGPAVAPVRIRTPDERPSIHRRIQTGLARGGRRRDAVGAASTGLLAAALPCGWLWSFVLVAAAAGSATRGAAVMAVFGLGSVPTLVAAGWIARRVIQRLGRWAPRVGAMAMLAIGVATAVGWGGRIPTRELAPSTAASDGGLPGEAPCHGAQPEAPGEEPSR